MNDGENEPTVNNIPDYQTEDELLDIIMVPARGFIGEIAQLAHLGKGADNAIAARRIFTEMERIIEQFRKYVLEVSGNTVTGSARRHP